MTRFQRHSRRPFSGAWEAGPPSLALPPAPASVLVILKQSTQIDDGNDGHHLCHANRNPLGHVGFSRQHPGDERAPDTITVYCSVAAVGATVPILTSRSDWHMWVETTGVVFRSRYCTRTSREFVQDACGCPGVQRFFVNPQPLGIYVETSRTADVRSWLQDHMMNVAPCTCRACHRKDSARGWSVDILQTARRRLAKAPTTRRNRGEARARCAAAPSVRSQ